MYILRYYLPLTIKVIIVLTLIGCVVWSLIPDGSTAF
jgi:hypothetical protein